MSMNPFCENAMEEAVRLKVGASGRVELEKTRQYTGQTLVLT